MVSMYLPVVVGIWTIGFEHSFVLSLSMASMAVCGSCRPDFYAVAFLVS